MNNPMIDGVKVELRSGNAFANIGLPDADKMKIG
jgi:hypothetical protein